MAQKQRSTQRRQKSSFPVFEYLDMLMPHKLVSRFVGLPRHVRWTIISAIASLVILWVFLRVVVGSINYWIDTRGPFLKDALYLPYNLTERPLPVYPEEVAEDAGFLVLPEKIADQYILQIPPDEEAVKATRQAELDAFLALSLPVEESLTALRESLGKQLGETPVPAVGEETASEVEVVATPVADDAIAATPAADVTVVPTAVPTINPVQIQVTALDGVLTHLSPLNEALKTADSIDLVYGSAVPLRNLLHSLAASGVAMPLGVEPFRLRIDELAAVKPPTIFRNNECLMAAKPIQREKDEIFSLPPCRITQRAWFAEQGEYVNSEGTSLHIAVAEFPRTVDAAWAVKQLFYRARAIGFTGDFALDNIIEYNYFFSQIEGVYTMAWSHENWVYSISGWAAADIDTMMKIFPY